MSNVRLWIVGKGGLLGSHLTKTAPSEGMMAWNPPVNRFSWKDPEALNDEFTRSLNAFFGALQNERWCIAWAAGTGTMGSTPEDLESETRTWTLFLKLLDTHIRRGVPPGTIFHASSAGSVYGNQPDVVLTEESSCQPESAYGRQKLAQEKHLEEAADNWENVSFLIGRITNLYGPNQNLLKPQGLISHISRCLLLQRPIHIFVPLDTIRDYIFVDDCVRRILRTLQHIDTRLADGKTERIVKIFASRQITTIAQIVGIFTRIAKKHPRIVCSELPLGSMYPRNLRFSTTIWPDLDNSDSTPFVDGIARVHQYQSMLHRNGRLTGL